MFLKPSFIIELLRPLFDHRATKQNLEAYLGQRHASLVAAKSQQTPQSNSNNLCGALITLISKAELSEDLLGFLWKRVEGLHADHYNNVLQTLVNSGVLFPGGGGGGEDVSWRH